MSDQSGGAESADSLPEPRVSEIMRTDPPVASPEESVASVARRMVEAGLPGLPVVSAGEIVGIVGETDLLIRYADVAPPGFAAFFDWIIRADAGLHYDEEVRRVAALTAEQLMTHPVYSIRASATLGEIATLMVDRKVNPVPVVDDDGLLVGLVTRADLLRLIARLEASGDTVAAPGDETV
jgi:CBS domain-containing protein